MRTLKSSGLKLDFHLIQCLCSSQDPGEAFDCQGPSGIRLTEQSPSRVAGCGGWSQQWSWGGHTFYHHRCALMAVQFPPVSDHHTRGKES